MLPDLNHPPGGSPLDFAKLGRSGLYPPGGAPRESSHLTACASPAAPPEAIDPAKMGDQHQNQH